MTSIFLQNLIEDIRFEDLPANWNSFNLAGFSKNKNLWNYQQEALKNAIKVLWKYFEFFSDYQKGENLVVNQKRKQQFFAWYENNELSEDLDIQLDKRRRGIYNLLIDYYPVEADRIAYEHFVNRMSFWMATGSGKTLIIIKLIQILKKLMQREEIPQYDILFLTHRDDLIRQLKKHVDEFNYANNELCIKLRELKDYADVKRMNSLFKEKEITVFFYRSLNIVDEQGELRIDFRDYDDKGKWYIFLDEAHKGDKQLSKAQHIYSILSRNGFLFNFSATFIDPRDIVTCAYEFNLSSFINAGYGKHILISESELKAFKDKKDYTDEEKEKIVLKTLILLTYIKMFYEEIRKERNDLYHNPLLLTLVHSVNIEDADLKQFFYVIEKIGKGKIEKEFFKSSLEELWQELKNEPKFMFEEDKALKIDEQQFKRITIKDVLKCVYNSETGGEIEISFRPSDKKQVAFKLTTADKHFGLMKTGDMPPWLREDLSKFNVNHRFEEEGFFETLNRENSEINILMGSRTFYEGWDSNRPNVINYINIGTGNEARKFILQSVGRGVRIEPVRGKRKRLLPLYNAQEIQDTDLFDRIKDKVLPLETLFIFGTKKDALKTVIGELKKEKKAGISIGSLFEVNKESKAYQLLIPIYKKAEQPLFKKEKPSKFCISDSELKLLDRFLGFIHDDRILLMKFCERCRIDPEKISFLRKSIDKKEDFYKPDEKNYKNLDTLIERVFSHFDILPEEFKELKLLENEIRHFTNINVELKDISEIQKKIEAIKEYPNQVKEIEKLYRKIPAEEYTERAKGLKSSDDFEYEHKRIKIKYIANHYYIPIILFDEIEKINYITHIIKTPSEARFISDLEDYLSKTNNKFKEFEWWMFSKLDESLDEVYIPYYNPNANNISKFYPDFIFWLKRENKYFIIFIDPKGTEYVSAYRKIEGYKEIFEEGSTPKVINYNGFKVKIKLFLRPEDVSKTLKEYRQYWFDEIEKMVDDIL